MTQIDDDDTFVEGSVKPPVIISVCINITWWRHQMKTVSASLALCEGKRPVTGGFPSRGFWYFLCQSKQTARHTDETPVFWDVIALIMTTLQCKHNFPSTSGSVSKNQIITVARWSSMIDIHHYRHTNIIQDCRVQGHEICECVSRYVNV